MEASIAQQRFQKLKKMGRWVSDDDRIQRRFEEMGLEREDVERMAKAVGLEADDIYLASSSGVSSVNVVPITATSEQSEGIHDLARRLRDLETAFSQQRTTNEQPIIQSENWNESGVVAELRRIANHFDPPNLEAVGTSYIAERLGVTTKWVGDLVRNGEIPKSCVYPNSGGGKYWRFWKQKIDKWIEER